MLELYWNVDTQRDFMDPDGKLAIDGAQEIVSNLERITQHAHTNNKKMVNTADWHNHHTMEISQTPNYETTFPEHCMENTRGAEYIPETMPRDPYVINWDQPYDKEAVASNRELVIRKDKFDVFAGNPHTDEVVDIIDPSSVVVYGVATNVCVDQAVMGLVKRPIDVYVVEDAIKGLPSLPVESVLQKWQDHGAKLITTDQLITGTYK